MREGEFFSTLRITEQILGVRVDGMKALKWIACLGALVGPLAVAPEARADVQLGAAFDIGVPVNIGKGNILDLSTGAGFDVLLGYRFRIPYQHIAIIPELSAGYTDLSTHLVRVRPGLRVGFGRFLVPYIFGHVGWGWATFEDPRATALSSRTDGIQRLGGQGPVYDAGLGLDVTVMRRLTLGAHAGYNVATVSTPRELGVNKPSSYAQWFNFGLNAAVFF
jgi:hypothetical protein